MPLVAKSAQTHSQPHLEKKGVRGNQRGSCLTCLQLGIMYRCHEKPCLT